MPIHRETLLSIPTNFSLSLLVTSLKLKTTLKLPDISAVVLRLPAHSELLNPLRPLRRRANIDFRLAAGRLRIAFRDSFCE